MCICCNNLTDKTFKIENRGYGSLFDLMNIEIPLCNACIKKFNVKKKWFTETPNKHSEYIYEDNIINLILNDIDKTYVRLLQLN